VRHIEAGVALHSATALIQEGQASVNLVAAIPSLHAGLTAAVSAFLWTRVRRKWRPLLVAYPLIMAFTLVYTAEHYVIDILLGWALAAVVVMASNRWEARRRDRASRPGEVHLAQGLADRPDGLGAGSEAVTVARGQIGGIAAVVAAFDFAFMGGSMGVAVGAALVAASRLAVERQAALIVIPSSGGARMQEGILSLMQMPRTIIAADLVKEARLPYIVVLTDPTTGGVAASFAAIGDIAIAEPGAVVGFAGARVIEETIHEKLPEGFQRAEYLLEHGMVDMVVKRGDLAATLARILRLLCQPAIASVPMVAHP